VERSEADRVPQVPPLPVDEAYHILAASIPWHLHELWYRRLMDCHHEQHKLGPASRSLGWHVGVRTNA